MLSFRKSRCHWVHIFITGNSIVPRGCKFGRSGCHQWHCNCCCRLSTCHPGQIAILRRHVGSIFTVSVTLSKRNKLIDTFSASHPPWQSQRHLNSSGPSQEMGQYFHEFPTLSSTSAPNIGGEIYSSSTTTALTPLTSWVSLTFLGVFLEFTLSSLPKCAGSSFYSSVDMQLFFIGLIIIYLLAWRAKVAYGTCVLLTLVCFVHTSYNVIKHETTGMLFMSNPVPTKISEYLDFVHMSTTTYVPGN